MTKLATLRPAVAVSSIRRSLLLAAPAISTIAALPAAHAATSVAAVGLILPASERVNGSRADWFEGFVREQESLGVSVPVMRTTYASGPTAMRATARRLLDAGCTTIAGWADANAAAEFAPTLERYGARFVVSELGAKSLRGELPANVVRTGADLWRRAHSAGAYLANEGARTALVATSFYESGFDLVGAFEQGFHSAGGQRVEIVVTGTPERDHGDRAWKRIGRKHRGFDPDAVFALYSGIEAREFFAFASQANAPARLRNRPLMVLSSMLVGPSASSLPLAAKRPTHVMHTRLTGAPATDSVFALTGRAAARLLVRNEQADWYGSISRDGGVDAELRVATTCTDCLYVEQNRAGWLMPYGA